MVCIAAFIILLIVGIFVAFISIFKPKVGKKYLKTLKRSWGCVGKRITLQKCETGLGDDIKNSILSKLIIKKPKLVKPVSVAIEVTSILVVLITVWSLVEGVKAGLALYSLGTCNVKHAEACSLGSEVCSIDGNEAHNVFESIGLWFSDWGEIFAAIPDKFRDWNAENFDVEGIKLQSAKEGATAAIDFFDPGCIVCLESFKVQLDSGFFDNYNVVLVPFPIQDVNGKFKYANSKRIAEYIFAVYWYDNPDETPLYTMRDQTAFKILERIYLEQDEQFRSYQDLFNDFYSAKEAEQELKDWLTEFGYDEAAIAEITAIADSERVASAIAKNNDIVVNNMHAKGIPTTIYDGKKHTGKYEVK